MDPLPARESVIMNSLHITITQRLINRFKAYSDLAGLLSTDLLTRTIDVPKHKSLANHLWCVVGARESYTKAIDQGAWSGFACSMQSFEPDDFRIHLEKSASAANDTVSAITDWTPERASLLAEFSEHEVMHEGQIIRHMYAIEQVLPESWKWA
jgi:hypothetical protein